MEELQGTILSALESNGGLMDYEAVYDAVPAELRPQMFKALGILKSEGKILQRIIPGVEDVPARHTVSLTDTAGSAALDNVVQDFVGRENARRANEQARLEQLRGLQRGAS